MGQSLTKAQLIWSLCSGKGVTHENVWHFGHIWHPFNNRIYQYNVLMDTENITWSCKGSEEYVTSLIPLPLK